MIIRNSWKNKAKQSDKFALKLRIGKLDIINFEADISRRFVMFTFMNFIFKNR
jgi:hypothetical protein